MRYLSVCSGIEAATVAWHPLGWTPAAFSEIEAFPRAVLAHHYPEVPCHGDFTTIGADDYGPIDLLVGGTPCQSFSIAGLRGGLADDRGNLALEYLRLADRKRPRWLVWENVPGVLSSLTHDAPDPCEPPPPLDLECEGAEVESFDDYHSEEVHAFECFLAGLRELGYGFAYRVLDAQFFGVAQRRRRVFVVGYLGDWRRAAAVLFERHSLSGHPAPRRKAREGTAETVTARTCRSIGTQDAAAGHLIQTFDRQSSGEYGTSPAASTVSARDYKGPSDLVCFSAKDHGADATVDCSPTLRSGGHSKSHANAGVMPAIAFNLRGREDGAQPEADPDNLAAMRAASGGSSRSYIAYSIMPMNSGKDYKARETDVAQPLMAGGPVGGNQGGDFIAQAVAFAHQAGGTQTRLGYDPNAGTAQTLSANQTPAVAFADTYNGRVTGETSATLGTQSGDGVSSGPTLLMASAVRRLTPRECERLQGFPDDYTLVPYRGKQAADGPRYKALGNSMAVPVMAYIGRRIAEVETIPQAAAEAA